MNNYESLNLKLHSLVIFRHLLCDSVLKLLPAVLCSKEKTNIERLTTYTAFVSELFKHGENLTEYVWSRVLEDENIYVTKRAGNEHINDSLELCLKNELGILEEVSRLSAEDIVKAIDYEGYLAIWQTGKINFYEQYIDRMKNINLNGYGIYSKYHMFTVKGSIITPVKAPDPIRLSDLKDYELEREAVINNTLALLKGKTAANTLLYGDAGTGKSSTVKAIVNEFGDRGLRLIEVTKKQLTEIPLIMEQLCNNPLKFIIFIDDLSFNSDNEDIGSLKAILEGSASSRTSNVVIYATSNRRHLMRETFSDRGNDDIHINETIQEQVSLSERFGLSVIFSKPDKRQYLKIVHELVREYDIKISEQEIDLRAERYALERGGRSPRAARHFIEYLRSME